MDDEVVVSDALAHVPRAMFAEKFCDFLTNLEADDLGSGKTIGCLLNERAMRRELAIKKARSSILKENLSRAKAKKEWF
jgi:hypothetical protein